MPSAHPLPIYLAAGTTFAALAARSFLLPLYVHDLGGDRVEVGLLFSVTTIVAAGLSLPAGFLADRFGRRRLIVTAIVTGAASQLGVGLTTSIPALFAWQAIAGVSGAAGQSGLMSALADVVPGPRLGRAMGWLTLAFQFGFLAGPAGAGLSLQWLSLQATLVASAGLFAVALVVVWWVPAGRRAAVGWNIAGPLREIATRRAFVVGSVGLLGATMLWGTMQAYLPLFGKEQLRLPETQIGYMIAIQAVFNGLARIPGGRLVDRMRRRGPIVVLGLAAYAACIAVLPHLSGFWATTALLALSVPFLATVYLALGVVFANLGTLETRGVAMGVYGTVLFIGLGAGPAVFGAVMERAGYIAGFTACGAVGLLLAAATALLRSERIVPRRTAPATSGG